MSDAILFVIPARGGSRRVPGKNLRHVAGIPLVGHAVRIARRAAAAIPGGPHAIVCSTDDPEIAAVAAAWGAEVPFLRPADLAGDMATSVDVVLHVVGRLADSGRRFRAVVMVQPTSPLTDPGDIRAAVARFDAEQVGIVSVTPSHPASWHQVLGDDDGRLTAAGGDTARVLLSGAFYVAEPGALAAARRFVEPGLTHGFLVAPARSVDVDEELDLVTAEAIARARAIAPLALGGRSTGSGRCLVVAAAEPGLEADPDRARRLVDAAAAAGADAVVLEGIGGDDAWAPLTTHAAGRDMALLVGLGGSGIVSIPAPLRPAAFRLKVAALADRSLRSRLARAGLPLVVSTGPADMREVAGVLDAIEEAGGPPVALLADLSRRSFPEEVPERPGGSPERPSAGTLRAAFGVPAGWAHPAPDLALVGAAVASGADLLEVRLGLDDGAAGLGRACLGPASLAALVAAVRRVEGALDVGTAGAATDRSSADRGGER